MKAITVHQPWATAIAEWGKSPENRGRNIVGSYRGQLAIHAGKIVDEDAFHDPLIKAHSQDGTYFVDDGRDPFPLGAIIGVATLVSVHHDSDHGPPSCSPWAQRGLWHLVLEEPVALAEPVPCRGALGLWTVPSGVDEQVALQLDQTVAR